MTPIAKQIARNNTADVILGGGLSRFDAADEAALEASGYAVLGSPASQRVATKSDLPGATGTKVFALFSKGNMTIEKYKAGHPASVQAQETTVAAMTANDPAQGEGAPPPATRASTCTSRARSTTRQRSMAVTLRAVCG